MLKYSKVTSIREMCFKCIYVAWNNYRTVYSPKQTFPFYIVIQTCNSNVRYKISLSDWVYSVTTREGPVDTGICKITAIGKSKKK